MPDAGLANRGNATAPPCRENAAPGSIFAVRQILRNMRRA